MRTKFLAVLAATLLAGTAASAATLNFTAEAAGNERGVADGTVITMDGLDVTFSATSVSGDAYAYFDSGAGLGVCKVLTTGNQCNPSNDDNVTAGETLTLSFDAAQDLSNIMFVAEGHGALTTTETLLVSVNGGAATEYAFSQFSGLSFSGVNTVSFIYGGSAEQQFYLGAITAVAAVPLPATLPLLAGALLLLRRRRRAASAV